MAEADTKKSTGNTKRKSKKKRIETAISIDHIARIEGKAGIEVIYDKTSVDPVKVRVFEGPRYFEAIVIGKPLDEAVAVCSRICSFCAAAHKVTAVQAAENAIGITPSYQTLKLRELLYLGDIVESHALHLFLLALPDYLGYPDAISMGSDFKNLLDAGLALKDIGADIQTVIGSRFIHQENVLIGGFGKLPEERSLISLRQRLKSLHNEAEEALENLVAHRNWPELSAKRQHLALKPYDDTYTMLGDVVKVTDDSDFCAEAYRMKIREKVVSHSFAKHCEYKKKPFMTGALSRYTLFGDGMTPHAKELARLYRHHLDSTNPMANNVAQALEIVHYVHRADEIIAELVESYNPNESRIKPSVTHADMGTSMSEAPRGLLAYTFSVGKNGLVESADIITPTTMFLAMIEEDLQRLTQSLLKSGNDDEQMICSKLETVVRSYDPCISCSVHLCDVESR